MAPRRYTHQGPEMVENQVGAVERVQITQVYTEKKRWRHSRPQPGCHLPNSSWEGIIKLFPPSESLVSDIPAGGRNVANLFFYGVQANCPECTSGGSTGYHIRM
jgi:hypothetical protein